MILGDERLAPGPDARIDWDHPLAQGLRHCWVGQMTTDLATGHQTAKAGNPGHGTTVYGTGVHAAGGAYVESVDSNSLTGVDRDATILVAGRVNSWTSPYTMIFDKAVGNNERDLSVMLDESGAVSYQGAWGLNGGDTVPVGLSAGSHFVLVVVARAADWSLEYWLDGRRCGATGTLGGTPTPKTCPLNVGGNPSSAGASHPDQVVSAVHAWTRQLSASEIAALHSDPFAMLEED